MLCSNSSIAHNHHTNNNIYIIPKSTDTGTFADRFIGVLVAPFAALYAIIYDTQQVRRRGGARIRWRQMSSLDQRGHFPF